MLRRLWRFVVAATLAALLPAVLAAQPTTITVLHVNDTHSRLDAFGPKDHLLNGTLGGLAKAATVIKRAEAQALARDEGTLLLHAGDASVGDFFWNKYLAIPEIRILQSLGLDAMTLGNHELDLGTSTLTYVMGAVQPPSPAPPFELLSSNLDTRGCDLTPCAPLTHMIVPSKLIEVMGVRVGIVGATTPDDPVASQGVEPMSFREGPDGETSTGAVFAVLNAAGALRAEPNLAQVVIVLSHLGAAYDKAIAARPEAALIDFIVEGHDHDLLRQPLEIANALGHVTRIVSAGEFYEHVGRLRFVVDGTDVSFLDYKVLPVNRGTKPDPGVKAMVDAMKQEIVAKYGDVYHRPIGYALWDIDKRTKAQHPERDSGMGNLVSDGLRAATRADIGIAATGFIAEGIYQGPVVGADVFRPLGYGYDRLGSGKDYPVVVATMTGAQLLQGLGLGVSLLGQTDALLLQVSGLTYRYDMSVADPRQRLIVSSVRVGGEAIDPEQVYTVAANMMAVEIAQAMLGSTIPYTFAGYTEYDAVHRWVKRIGVLMYRPQGRIRDVSVVRR
jgi:2',3'-cyclic-nucleotide 2'-phosphodiesterase (5'-nucleotidase family)